MMGCTMAVHLAEQSVFKFANDVNVDQTSEIARRPPKADDGVGVRDTVGAERLQGLLSIIGDVNPSTV